MTLNQSAANETYAQCLVTGVLALIAVILRCVARAKSKAGYGADDFFILLAISSLWAYNSLIISGVSMTGAGVLYTEMPPDMLTLALKILYANTILTVVTISAAKLSVLCLYHRIFSIDRGFRMALIIVGLASVAWLITGLGLGIFRCIPIYAAWDPLIPAQCYDLELAFVVTESINCAMDLTIVCLPVLVLKKLQLPLRHKIGISFIFLLGGLVVITSIIRLVYVYKPSDSKYAMLASNLWIVIQLSCAIICACLPVYKPILPKMTFVISGFNSLFHSLSSLLARRRRSDRRKSQSRNLGQDESYTLRASMHNERYDHYDSLSDQAAIKNEVTGGYISKQSSAEAVTEARDAV